MAQDQNKARNLADKPEPPTLTSALGKFAPGQSDAKPAAGATPPPIPSSSPANTAPPPAPVPAKLPALPPAAGAQAGPGKASDAPTIADKPKIKVFADAPAAMAAPSPAAMKPAAPPAVAPALPQASAAPAEPMPELTIPGATPGPRRPSRRRSAGPVRGKVAANDDAPSIGGLIYALEQKPSGKPFFYAAIASAVWAVIGLAFAIAIIRAELGDGATIGAVLSKPTTFLTLASILVPIAVLWFLALLAWRSEELRLRSSTMTEVAVRLAEPDRMAEKSVASLGQAVRRQVSFMNDAVSRALGRAGELEALVHNEVTALERSYEENERKIRGLISELTGERHALLNTSERVADTLRNLGTEVPTLIEKLSNQQVKLAQIIQGAGDNLNALESAIGQSTGKLESTLGARTTQLQNVLEQYTVGLATALGSRAEQMQSAFSDYLNSLNSSLDGRTERIQLVFEEYAKALDSSLANRAQALDIQLIERTKSLDIAFSERLRGFDESILRSTMAIDSAVGEKARALTSALDTHAKTFSETIGRQAHDLDETVMQGISAVRRTSESITRQSLKAIEGLAGQSNMLKNVSENLLGQINSVTNRFENQGQAILKAANALESANYKIDSTLQNRHADLSQTLDRMSGKADEFGKFVEGYSSSIEGSLSEAERRARAAAEELRAGTESRHRHLLADLERFKADAGAESERALEELRNRFASVSSEVTQQLGSLSSKLGETTDEMRERAARAAADFAQEQSRLRDQFATIPQTTRESADAMRRALQDQLRALEQLANFTSREGARRDVSMPVAPEGSLTSTYANAIRNTDANPRALSTLSSALAQEIGNRQRPAGPAGPAAKTGNAGALRSSSASTPPAENRDAWSVGDLLKRASLDEDAPPYPRQAPPPAPPAEEPPRPAAQQPYNLNIEVIARALDPSMAASIWSLLRAGQLGVMARSIYSNEGRAAFDEVSRRLKSDPDLQRTVARYLMDFERIQKEAEQKDPSGRLAQNHLVSDTGRVYLFLAHASGRVS